MDGLITTFGCGFACGMIVGIIIMAIAVAAGEKREETE